MPRRQSPLPWTTINRVLLVCRDLNSLSLSRQSSTTAGLSRKSSRREVSQSCLLDSSLLAHGRRENPTEHHWCRLSWQLAAKSGERLQTSRSRHALLCLMVAAPLQPAWAHSYEINMQAAAGATAPEIEETSAEEVKVSLGAVPSHITAAAFM